MHRALTGKHNPMQLEYFVKTALFFNSIGKILLFFPVISVKVYFPRLLYIHNIYVIKTFLKCGLYDLDYYIKCD